MTAASVLVAVFLLAGLLALALTPLAVRVAWATGYLDHPAARKLHVSATALLGGVAVFVAALAAWGGGYAAWLHRGATRDVVFLLAGAFVALVLGLIDDRFGMRPTVKLVGQATAAVTLLASGSIPDLGLPVAVEVFLAALALVALLNAVNFLDNMNGMVAGISAVALTGFALDSMRRGAAGVAMAQLALAGACVGFLPWNFPRARIFLGDAGSHLLGYSLGASALLAFQAAPHGWGRLGPILVLGYPAFDLIFVVITRLRAGRKVYQGGKDHTNHRLASILQCPIRTVLLMWAAGAALCASGLAVLWLNRPLPALLLSGLWTMLMWALGRRLSSVPPVSSPPPHPAR